MKKIKQKKRRTLIINTIKNIIFCIFVLIIGALIYFLVNSRLAGGVPKILGYQMYIVSSGSMSPTINTGSVIFVNPTPTDIIRTGDIITFKGFDGNGTLTTHRVVGINNEGSLSFLTRGDANNMNDPNPVSDKSVVGRVSYYIPSLGYLLGFIRTKRGAMLLVYVPALIVITLEFVSLYKYIKVLSVENEEKKNKTK